MTTDQPAQPVKALPPKTPHTQALIFSNDSRCIAVVRDAIQPLVKRLCIATHAEAFTSILVQARAFQLVIIDIADLRAMWGLMQKIKMVWPQSEIILISNSMHSWIESIQRGAYEMLPKPINSADLVWAAVGAILKHSPTTTMRSVGH
jgi:DNA-binding NtrC family response regulator